MQRMARDVSAKRHQTIDDQTLEPEKLAEAARFPEENPNPVFRVAANGSLLCANLASRPLLEAWGVVGGGYVPVQWRERIAAVLAAGEARKWDAKCGDRLFQLHCVPIVAADYVNIYGADVTDRAAALKAWHTSEARYRTLFDSIDEGFSVIEVLFDEPGKAIDFRFLETNPAFERQTGLMDVIGRRAREMIPLLEESWFERYGRVALTGEPARLEHTAEPLGRYYDVYAFRIGDPAERKVAVLFNDIAARKQAEAEREQLLNELRERSRLLEAQAAEIRSLNAGLERRVQERTAELEAIFAGVPDALYVATEDGVVRANRAALEGFGVDTLEELQRQGLDLPTRIQARYADTGKPISSAESVVAVALRGEHVVRDTLARNPKTNEERIYRSAAAPIVIDGQVTGAVCLAADITEQKRAQEKAAYQACVLENLDDAIVAFDADLRVTAWNRKAAEQYGWTAEEALGAYAPDVVGSQLTEEERAEILRSLAERGNWRGEIRHTRRDGTPLVVEATTMAWYGEAGQLRGLVTVNRDITLRKNAEAQNAQLLERLRASQEQLQALSRRLVTMQESERSYVADQLYNQAGQVLAALQMQLSRLGRNTTRESPADQLQRLMTILQEAIGRLHDLARELRPVGLDRSPLARVLEGYATEFGKAHGLAVRFCPGAAETLRVPADVGTALFRCVQEGLTNVARHARASEVVLSLEVDGGDLVVSLADNGVGFAVQKTTDRGDLRLANGLGLASMRERLEIIGGQFTILSGKAGTTLTLRGPLNEPRNDMPH